HARYLAERLARHVQVEVLTTCAQDYITWADAYPAGASTVGPLSVRRFPVMRPRDPQTFGAWSERVFGQRHSVNDELAWLDAEGPTSPELVRYIAAHQADYDFFLFFSFRYYHAYHGARAVPGKAILVPTAERDEALGLGVFPSVLRGVRACMYNSPEERVLLQAVAGTDEVPGVVVGIGSEVPASASPSRFRQRTGITGATAIYIGRIDENKGCAELFDYWKRYSEITPGGMTLVLIGTPVLPVPDHPRIKHLGFVSDQEKYDALAAAGFLIMPSYFESLSMVALEAWAMGKPVLANGKCDVLRGQAIRSNAGLYYDTYAEFVEAVRVLESSPMVASALGRNGSAFFRTHYAWPVIERKYLDMFDRLTRESGAVRTMGAVPGWWGRRQRALPPAREVLASLPSGPVTDLRDAGQAAPAHTATTRPPRRDEARPRDSRSHDGRVRDSRSRDGRPREGKARDSRTREGQPRDGGTREGQAREARARDGRPSDGRQAPPPADGSTPATAGTPGQPRGRGANRGRRARRPGGRPPRKDGP
ncbi:MAG TPA: glycosyltransferase, partial [Vicinamibacterales bacterium]|nr:glycosyltransferase [Vicinamibacterales bacterium]